MQELVHSPKTPGIILPTTIGTGIATWIDLIPDNIGKLASLVGLVFSALIVYIQWRKFKLDEREKDITYALLQQKKEARAKGFSMRREDNCIEDINDA